MKVVAQVSGGYDSAAALLVTAMKRDVSVIVPVFYDYGQQYRSQEQLASQLFVERVRKRWRKRITTLRVVQLPLAHEGVFIPYRNLVLTTHSLNLAWAVGARTVVVGSKSIEHRPGDPYSFKDSTLKFYNALTELAHSITEAPEQEVTIEMPVLDWTKKQVLQLLTVEGVPLDKLWCCYSSKLEPCGECYHCITFNEAVSELRKEGVNV